MRPARLPARAWQILVITPKAAQVVFTPVNLLPGVLPAAVSAEMAVRYVPGARKVGGDWYDVFGVSSG